MKWMSTFPWWFLETFSQIYTRYIWQTRVLLCHSHFISIHLIFYLIFFRECIFITSTGDLKSNIHNLSGYKYCFWGHRSEYYFQFIKSILNIFSAFFSSRTSTYCVTPLWKYITIFILKNVWLGIIALELLAFGHYLKKPTQTNYHHRCVMLSILNSIFRGNVL